MSISVSRARAITARFSHQKVLVVGDLMLDHYIHGHVSRISPEAPVPVLLVAREHSVPGGACNVAANVRALGGAAAVAGVMGRDAHGAALERLLQSAGIETRAVLRLPGHPTTVKTRVIAERQQVVRVDWEKPARLNDRQHRELARKIEHAFEGVTAVIFEDYGKGVLTQPVVDAVMAEAQRRGVPVGLDPKENYQLRFDGLALAKPNRKEAFAHAGLPDPGPRNNPTEDVALLEVANRLMEKWKPALLLITLGAQGLLLAERGKKPYHVPTRAREVFDLSGAGDTVIATCMLALAAGADARAAAELANYAAGVVVGKLGTATCSREELLEYLARG
ncbi:MAG: D-glycero-beta-D-manno-heptose-7-phosphate kinase [Kiritimatiellae bacterium]|nr:D-glycero-beta-D-manno-heptose-7-phosphate kinase [Kiritimatiellia bacterium]MDW8458391.1 D-glycero-beta-D-manno-heptose-7-phosphate kinase [Verrucomicrobiota bacterium]